MGWLKRLKNHRDALIMKGTGEEQDEKQIETIVEELKSEMAEAQVRIANHLATVNELCEREENMLELVNRRHDEAKLAVVHGDDDRARLALMEEQSFRKQYQAAVEARKQAEETLVTLRIRIQELESQIYGISHQKDELLARFRTAELEKSTADVKGGLDSRGRAFQKFEEKVVRKELEAEAHTEIAGLPYGGKLPLDGESADEMLSKLQSALDENPSLGTPTSVDPSKKQGEPTKD